MDNMLNQIDEGGIYQGGILCIKSYRDREKILFITSNNQVCGLAQKSGKYIKVEYLKRTTSPQLQLPCWSDDSDPSLTDSVDDAKRLIEDYFRIRANQE